MSELEIHRHVASSCLNCGKNLNAAASFATDKRPDPGDMTVCVDCGHVMIYADDLSVRAPTDAEMVDIAGDPVLLETQRRLAAFRDWEKAQQELS